MTSKNWSSNFPLVVDALKRKIWVFILATVVFFFTFPVGMTISLQGRLSNDEISPTFVKDAVESIIETFFSVNNVAISLILVFFAIFCGIVFFSYIHSKKKVDFYHSLPIKRQKLFFINYIAGALSIIVPYVVFYLIALGILGILGYGSFIHFPMVVWSLLLSLSYFLAAYSLTVLAGVLTGHLLIHGCVALYFMLVIPVAFLDLAGLMSVFFQTHTTVSFWMSYVYTFSSPFYYMFTGVNSGISPGLVLLLNAIFTGIILSLGAVFYKRRKGESAGKSIAFSWFVPLVKLPLIILGAIGFGLFFHSMGSESMSMGFWSIFGVIVGGLLVSRALEVILAFDIKAIKTHWLSFIGCMIIVAGILGGFALDITGYDTYQPKATEIKSVNLVLGNFNVYGAGYISDYNNETNTVEYDFGMNSRYTLEGQKEINAVLDIVENGIENLDMVPEKTDSVMPLIQEKAMEQEDSFLNTGSMTIPISLEESCWASITYTLHNGNKVKRHYNYVNKKETLSAVESLLVSSEFKKHQLAFLEYDDVLVNSLVYGDSAYSTYLGNLSKEARTKIIAAYKKDAYNLTINDAETKLPLGILDFTNFTPENQDVEKDYGVDIQAPIYETYTNTLAVLKEIGYGYEEYGLLSLEDVESISFVKKGEDGHFVEEVLPQETYRTILEKTYPGDCLSYFFQVDESQSYLLKHKDGRELYRYIGGFWN